jgi:hypothetical protein
MSPYGEDGPESEWDKHRGNADWHERGDELFEEVLDRMIEDFGPNVMDERAAELMYDTWFSAEIDEVSQAEAFWDFFEHTGLDIDDFHWDDWRAWYES